MTAALASAGFALGCSRCCRRRRRWPALYGRRLFLKLCWCRLLLVSVARYSYRSRRRWTNVTAFLIVPGGLVVSLSCGIEPGIQTILPQLESFLNHKYCVRVVYQIVFGNPIVLNCIVDQTAEKRDVDSCPNLNKEVCVGCRSCNARIKANYLRVTL